MSAKSKEETLQVKLHASLSYRLTLNFAVMLVGVGVFLACVFLGIRLHTVSDSYRETAEEMMYRLENGTAEETLLAQACRHLVVISSETKEVVYEAGTEAGRLHIGKWYVSKPEDSLQFYVKYKIPVVLYGVECKAEAVFDWSEEWGQIRQELWLFCLWFLGLLPFASLLYYAVNKAGLRPIDEISTKVSRLNLQTIHSERLNVEGTENELKALAVGINGMLDRMEQAYEAQKQFVSEASHELRTPITVLQGYSAMLRRWGAEDKEVLAESVEAIESEAKSMQELVEKLLFLSRHERRKLPFSKERFDMAEVIRELEREMVYLSGTRIMECPVCESVRVYGDRQLLKQAIRVFLDNAVKYTKEGDRISLSCRNCKGACEISVEDTGLGMRREDLEGIFGRFFRADTVRGKNIEGHGLGLSIARLIIDGHAGKIAVRTQYTKGSCFTVTIPRQRGI